MEAINLKIGKVGGLSQARLIRDVAEAAGVRLTIEDMWGGDIVTAAISHLAGSTRPEMLFTVSFMNDWVREHVAGHQPRSQGGVGFTSDQVGATTGTGLLWLMLLSTPMLYCLEEMSTRLGIVTKRGICRNLRVHYSHRAAAALIIPVVLANVITTGADLSGASAALHLLTGIAWEWWTIPLAALTASTLGFASYRTISRFLLLLTPLFVLYIITGFIVHPQWNAVLRATFIPSMAFTPTFLTAALGLLGATLTPYMFFWQTTEEIEAHHKVEDLPHQNLDVAVGMLYANLVFYFIILVAGVVFYGKGVRIETVADA